MCPGVLRPWSADDGALVRVRLVGGWLEAAQLHGLLRLSSQYGEGGLHLTKRANVQVRAVSDPDAFADGVETLGLLPSRSHDLVRNIVVAPQADHLRELAFTFDEALRAAPDLAELPARFLFAFDDRGNLAHLHPDLGVLATSSDAGRLVVAGMLGEQIPLHAVPARLVELARVFLEVRGDGPSAPWHVSELPAPPAERLAPAHDPYPVVVDRAGQVDVPDGRLTLELVESLPSFDAVVVTPWKGLLLR
jgi:precorrin-3B synthase